MKYSGHNVKVTRPETLKVARDVERMPKVSAGSAAREPGGGLKRDLPSGSMSKECPALAHEWPCFGVNGKLQDADSKKRRTEMSLFG